MPRNLSFAMLAALQSSNLQPVFFVQLTFASATVYVWSGQGSTTWNSHTWQGLESLLSIGTMPEGTDIQARGIAVTITGIPTALLADAEGEFQIGLPAAIYMGLDSGGSLIASPVAAWIGRMDQPTIDVDGESFAITVACESRLMEMNVAIDRRLTHQDQTMTWPGDLGLQFVDGIQEMALFWGQSATVTNNI